MDGEERRGLEGPPSELERGVMPTRGLGNRRSAPVRTELVEVPFFCSPTSNKKGQGFDKLGPNGVGITA